MPYLPPVQSEEAVTHEIAINREITKWFISMDPSTITLIPRQHVRNASNAWEMQDLAPRDPQDFKFVQGGIVRTSNEGLEATELGTQRRFDYIMIGNWDAIVEIGDHWSDGEQEYKVTGILPYNDYEVKAGIVSFGAEPDHG